MPKNRTPTIATVNVRTGGCSRRARDEVSSCAHQSDAGRCRGGPEQNSDHQTASVGDVPARAASGPRSSYSSVPSGCGLDSPRCGAVTTTVRSARAASAGRWATSTTVRSAPARRSPATTARSVAPSRPAVGSSSAAIGVCRDEHPGQRDALPLSDRQAGAVLAETSVDAIRQVVHEVGAGTTQRLGDGLRPERHGATTRTLSATVPRTKPGCCGIQAIWSRQLAGFVEVAGAHRPRGRSSDAEETGNRRRLAATTRADQRHGLAGFDLERRSKRGALAVRVAHAHVVEVQGCVRVRSTSSSGDAGAGVSRSAKTSSAAASPAWLAWKCTPT